MDNEGMCNLIAAVVNLAKRDYYKATKGKAPAIGDRSKESLEAFFRSEWLQTLSLGRASASALMAQARRGEFRG